MSRKKTDSNIRPIRPFGTTVEIKPHPNEILELDEETIAIGRAKLAGIEFEDLYGEEDRVSPEFMIRQQRQKIRDLFRSSQELVQAFSSTKKKEETYKDMQIDGIDLDFIKDYCKKEQLAVDSDAEALLAIAFEVTPSGDANV